MAKTDDPSIVITPIDLFEAKPTCEETTGATPDGDYTRCGAPATVVVLSERGKRLYFMCNHCGSHNIHNRGAKLVAVGMLMIGPAEEL